MKKRKRHRFVYILVEVKTWEADRLLSCWTTFLKAEAEKNRLLRTVNGGYGQLSILKEVIQ